MHSWIKLSSINDISKIENYISKEYNPEKVANSIKNGVSNAVKSLLIEEDYTDKDYRSTYYHFYSKKGRKYLEDCVRLHFFDEAISYDPDTQQLTCDSGELSDHYFGFMVLRPTGIATIGRSILTPDIRGLNGLTITAVHKVHLFGYELSIHGFPSMDQHIDISVCAHVACWSILRHLSEKYSSYKEYLVHDITLMAQTYNPGGLIPSRGLQTSHAERVFQEAGTFPLYIERVYDPNKKESAYEQDPSFYRQLISYIESGVPVFAADHSRGHAFSVVGYERFPYIPNKGSRTRYAWDSIKQLIVIDDNFLPYFPIPANGSSPATHYIAEDIDTLIVPLPEKVFYPADAVDELALALRQFEPMISLPIEGETVVRYFMTTGSALRRFMRSRESEFDPQLLSTVMLLPFSQFIWIIEFSSDSQWDKGIICARAVVDATASAREIVPLWLFHDGTNALIYDRRAVDFDINNMQILPLNGMKGSVLTRMDQNLRVIAKK